MPIEQSPTAFIMDQDGNIIGGPRSSVEVAEEMAVIYATGNQNYTYAVFPGQQFKFIPEETP